MKILLLIISLVFLDIESYSQDSTKPYKIICGYPQTFPEYPGGSKALKKYLEDSLTFPSTIVDSGWSAKIIVKFYVDSFGFVQEPVILKDEIKDSTIQADVIRVIKSMPKWKPGTEYGKPVKVNYVLPITYSKQSDEEENKIDSK
ncbi:MAG: energy transducer TonB [Chitinophagales bacterium]|nr:energy transducer TonB [Chitinophagales bacterium]